MRYILAVLLTLTLGAFTFGDILKNGRNGPPDVECLGAGCDNDRGFNATKPEPDPGDDDKGHGNDDDGHDDDNPGKKKEK
jgi:hypothetical protein